jgi:hypothetical protein
MKTFYRLNLPVSLLSEHVNTETYPEFKDFDWGVWDDDSSKYLSSNGINFLHNHLNLTERSKHDGRFQKDTVKVFRGDPDTELDIHRDRGVCWAINLVWGSTSSEMIWYEETSETITSDAVCSILAEYKKYHKETMNIIERTSFVGPTLVRIDIPHNVINYDKNNTRWCMSIRDYHSTWTWEEAVEYFKPWISNE